MFDRQQHTLMAALLAVGLAACNSSPVGVPADSDELQRQGLPVSEKTFANNPAHFQFAVVGDRTGGHRDGVFAHAMQQLNWLQRLGRSYYHFRYRDVLFLVLSTEDPPTASDKKARLAELGVSGEKYRRAVELLQGEPAEVAAALAMDPELASIAAVLASGDRATVSDAQVEYMARALADNTDARWTFVLMHKPAWKYEAPGFTRLETLLSDRARYPGPYNVGHHDRGWSGNSQYRSGRTI